MFWIDSSVAVPAAMLVAAGLLGLGFLFHFAPKDGLKLTRHHAEDLPAVMAGRYFFFAFVIVAVAWEGSPILLLAVFCALSGVAFLDAATYRSRGKTFWPHLAAGIAALVIPVIVLFGQSH